MGLEVIDKVYTSSEFIPLAEHNSQTPATFFGATPVLHLYCPQSTIQLQQSDLATAPVLEKFCTQNTDDGEATGEVDVWVTSKFVALGSQATNTSIRIDYTTIAVHGQQEDAVMLILNLNAEDDMDDEHESVTIHLLPKHAQSDGEATVANGESTKHYAAELYKAIGDCQELNPDPEMDDSEDGDDAPAPAFPAGGWVTADNMHEFMDEDGNFQMPALGQGAGSIRTADALENDAENDTKWQRTD